MSNDDETSQVDEDSKVNTAPNVGIPDSESPLNSLNNNNNEENDDNEEKKSMTMKIAIANRKILEQRSSSQQIFDKETGETLLQRDIPNKIIVARGKKISFYYERARRVLRLFDGMIVTGFGTTVCMACSLVEVLKRNQMAVITNIETKLDIPINYVNINENYNNPQQQYYYQHAPPQTAIEFHLKVGKYGKHLSGYHQRKIIELFEKYDQLSGFVTVKDVRSMQLYEVFHSNEAQIVSAELFINDVTNLHGVDDSFILPDFIRYCSLIIHPLMKDNVFKKILYYNFQIGNYWQLLNRDRNENEPQNKEKEEEPPSNEENAKESKTTITAIAKNNDETPKVDK